MLLLRAFVLPQPNISHTPRSSPPAAMDQRRWSAHAAARMHDTGPALRSCKERPWSSAEVAAKQHGGAVVGIARSWASHAAAQVHRTSFRSRACGRTLRRQRRDDPSRGQRRRPTWFEERRTACHAGRGRSTPMACRAWVMVGSVHREGMQQFI